MKIKVDFEKLEEHADFMVDICRQLKEHYKDENIVRGALLTAIQFDCFTLEKEERDL